MPKIKGVKQQQSSALFQRGEMMIDLPCWVVLASILCGIAGGTVYCMWFPVPEYRIKGGDE